MESITETHERRTFPVPSHLCPSHRSPHRRHEQPRLHTPSYFHPVHGLSNGLLHVLCPRHALTSCRCCYWCCRRQRGCRCRRQREKRELRQHFDVWCLYFVPSDDVLFTGWFCIRVCWSGEQCLGLRVAVKRGEGTRGHCSNIFHSCCFIVLNRG